VLPDCHDRIRFSMQGSSFGTSTGFRGCHSRSYEVLFLTLPDAQAPGRGASGCLSLGMCLCFVMFTIGSGNVIPGARGDASSIPFRLWPPSLWLNLAFGPERVMLMRC